MDIFEFKSYKKYVKQRIEGLPKRGYGQLKKLSSHMGVSSTFASQVFQGEKSLNLEQATLVCEFFGLSELETEYFLKLVLLERAGTERLRKILEKEIDKLAVQAKKISNRLQVSKVLAEEDKAIFYSDWYMSAIRLLIGISGYQDLDAIAEYFHLPRKIVGDAIQFLLRAGLVVNDKGVLKVGPQRTHLEADSPFIKLHHLNWRYKALEHVKLPYPEKLHYSSPMTIGKDDIEKVRAKILKFIEEVGHIVDPSPNEELMCLNIDWFKVQPKV